MKLIISSFLSIIAASTLWCRAEVPPFQSSVIQWDHVAASNNAIGYRVYIIDGLSGQTNYVGFTNGNRFIIENATTSPQRWFITTTNLGMESDPCFPNMFKPSSPEVTRQISTTIKTVVPGIVESSLDLQNFSESFRFNVPSNNSQTIIYKHYPNEPAKFFRTRVLPPSYQPPALPQ